MRVLLALTLAALTGCTQYRALVATNGAAGADAALETAEWAVCASPTGGALERRYSLFTDPTNPKAEGWAQLCHGVQQGRTPQNN